MVDYIGCIGVFLNYEVMKKLKKQPIAYLMEMKRCLSNMCYFQRNILIII